MDNEIHTHDKGKRRREEAFLYFFSVKNRTRKACSNAFLFFFVLDDGALGDRGSAPLPLLVARRRPW